MEKRLDLYRYPIKDGKKVYYGHFTVYEGVKSPIENATKIKTFTANVRGW